MHFPGSPRLHRTFSASETKPPATTTPKRSGGHYLPYGASDSPPSCSSSNSSSLASAHMFSTPESTGSMSSSDMYPPMPSGRDARKGWIAPDEWGVVLPEGPAASGASGSGSGSSLAEYNFPGVPDGKLEGAFETPYDYAGLDVDDVLRGGGEEFHRSLGQAISSEESLSEDSGGSPFVMRAAVTDGASPWGYEPKDEWGGTFEVERDLLRMAPPKLPIQHGGRSRSGGKRSKTHGGGEMMAKVPSGSKLANRKSEPPQQRAGFLGGFQHMQQFPGESYPAPPTTPPTLSRMGSVEKFLKSSSGSGRRRSLVSRIVRPTSSGDRAGGERAGGPPPATPPFGRRKASLPSPTFGRHGPTVTPAVPLELALNSMLRSPKSETYVSSHPPPAPSRGVSRSMSTSAGGFLSRPHHQHHPHSSPTGATSMPRVRSPTNAGSSPSVVEGGKRRGSSSQTLQTSNGSSSAATVTLGHGIASAREAVDIEREVLRREAQEAQEAEEAGRMNAVRRWRRGLSLKEGVRN